MRELCKECAYNKECDYEEWHCIFLSKSLVERLSKR